MRADTFDGEFSRTRLTKDPAPMRAILIHSESAGARSLSSNALLEMLQEAGYQAELQSPQDGIAGLPSDNTTMIIAAGGDGTVTNVAGWVQRLQQPLKPAVTTVAPHAAAAHLGQTALDGSLDFTEKSQPAELFDRVAAAVPAFKFLSYGELADLGRGLGHGEPLAARRPRLEGTPQWEPDPVAPTYTRPFQLRRGA